MFRMIYMHPGEFLMLCTAMFALGAYTLNGGIGRLLGPNHRGVGALMTVSGMSLAALGSAGWLVLYFNAINPI